MSTRGGPKHIPAAIKIARGTVSSRKPTPSAGLLVTVPAAPQSLGETGKAKWTEWGQRLLSLKMLESRFLDALEMYCRAWDRLASYEAVLEETGEFFVAESGYVGRHPAANGAKQARDEIRRYQQEFGLTPSSASGVKVAATTAADDKRKRFFAEKKA